MTSVLSVLTDASSADQPTAITNVGSNTGTIEDLFIPKVDFSDSGQAAATTCYVIDGGDSTSRPCDPSA